MCGLKSTGSSIGQIGAGNKHAEQAHWQRAQRGGGYLSLGWAGLRQSCVPTSTPALHGRNSGNSEAITTLPCQAPHSCLGLLFVGRPSVAYPPISPSVLLLLREDHSTLPSAPDFIISTHLAFALAPRPARLQYDKTPAGKRMRLRPYHEPRRLAAGSRAHCSCTHSNQATRAEITRRHSMRHIYAGPRNSQLLPPLLATRSAGHWRRA